MEGESRRHQDTEKNMRKLERYSKELQLGLDEGRRHREMESDAVEKLQAKIKQLKRQVEETVKLLEFEQKLIIFVKFFLCASGGTCCCKLCKISTSATHARRRWGEGGRC